MTHDEYLRLEFERLLTTDSKTTDRRRRDYNQAIFASRKDGGYAVFNRIDLYMILEKFDQAIKNTTRREAMQ